MIIQFKISLISNPPIYVPATTLRRMEQSDVWASSSQAPPPPHTLLFRQPLFSTDNIGNFLT